MTALPTWTAEAVQALPEEVGVRNECVDGVLLVSPAPRLVHQIAVSELLVLLAAWCNPTGTLWAVSSPIDLILDPKTLVQPALSVFRRRADGSYPASVDEAGLPLLVIEVLSPGTARADRFYKRRRYLQAGIEYFIIDLDSRLVERWLPDAERPEVLAEQVRWHPDGASAPFVLDLEPFFTRILGEP